MKRQANKPPLNGSITAEWLCKVIDKTKMIAFRRFVPTTKQLIPICIGHNHLRATINDRRSEFEDRNRVRT